MPFGNRTGPAGLGPGTGRGAGFCSGFAGPGFMNPGSGWRCWGGGRGWRNWFRATGMTGWQRMFLGHPFGETWSPYATPTPEAELEALRKQASFLEKALESVRRRMETLASKTGPQ